MNVYLIAGRKASHSLTNFTSTATKHPRRLLCLGKTIAVVARLGGAETISVQVRVPRSLVFFLTVLQPRIIYFSHVFIKE